MQYLVQYLYDTVVQKSFLYRCFGGRIWHIVYIYTHKTLDSPTQGLGFRVEGFGV